MVSVCPDDFDEDGINDNVDLDNDNDGILNSVESLGKGVIDFTNIEAPVISLPNGATDSSSARTEPAGSASASIYGSADGVFKTALQATGVIEEVVYTFDPILRTYEPLNIRLIQSGTSSTNNIEESFKLRAYPDRENFTILDPGEVLLVNDGTGYKVVPEVGITGNIIDFKYNPSPLDANLSFEFIGKNIDGLKFTHRLNAAAAANAEFNGKLEIIEYKLDTDVDGDINANDLDSDEDGCSDSVEAFFFTFSAPLTYDNGMIGSRGEILTWSYDEPRKNNNGDYLYLTFGTAPAIDETAFVSSGAITEGEVATFSAGSANISGNNFSWSLDGVTINNDATFSGVNTDTLEINSTDISLNGKELGFDVWTEDYLCTTYYKVGDLTVLANADPPKWSQELYTFCGDDSATVQMLYDEIKAFNASNTTIDDIGIFDVSTGGVALALTDLLTHNKTYYAEAYNALGVASPSRPETEVFISDPVLTASFNEVCLGETTTLSVSGVAQTATEFKQSNPALGDAFLNYNDSSYFLDSRASAVQPWEDAKVFIDGLGAGATMYQVNSLAEHDAVWNALVSSGLTSTRFWLGLKQFPGLNPTNQIDEGWYWLNGEELDKSWSLWYTDEPNDTGTPGETGGEDYGQFNYNASMGKYFNDIGSNNGNSVAVIEFTGTTSVSWSYKDPASGAIINIPDLANSIDVTPEKTTTYYYTVVTLSLIHI